jgi:hypothetical protein
MANKPLAKKDLKFRASPSLVLSSWGLLRNTQECEGSSVVKCQVPGRGLARVPQQESSSYQPASI